MLAKRLTKKFHYHNLDIEEMKTNGK